METEEEAIVNFDMASTAYILIHYLGVREAVKVLNQMAWEHHLAVARGEET